MTEIQLYDLLIKNNLEEDIDFVINKKYPESTFFYDFFFPQLNEYIEIAGRLDNLDYQKHMEFKQKQFNATILEPSMAKKYFKDIIQRVKS